MLFILAIFFIIAIISFIIWTGTILYLRKKKK